MMPILRAAVFHLLLFCATQILGISIQSVPEFNSEGVILVKLEETVSLGCELDNGTQADEELVWLRNDATVSLKDGNNKGISRVCVTPIYEDNGATFTCYQRKNSTNRASVTLNVQFAPDLSGTEEITVEEEAELVLKCNIMANPLVSSVMWTLNGSIVDLLAGGFIVINDGLTSQLKASNVERRLHEGTYQCTTNSTFHGEHSKIFQVTATDKTMKFPLGPLIAGVVVVALTATFAIFSRWKAIVKCCK